MTPQRALPRLLVLTDRAQLRLGRGLVRTVGECVEAGLTHVVLRELDLPDERRAALAAALVEVGATVIAAHRPLPGAVGVHVASAAVTGGNRPFDTLPDGCNGQAPHRKDGYPSGRSCHSRDDIAAAAAAGADYATLGPFGPSASKPGYGPPRPLTELHGHSIPVYALGGVTATNAEDMLDAGAYGVAVMGAVMRASDPTAVVRDLLAVTG